MQRRSFLKNAACIGACASLVTAGARAMASEPESTLILRLLKSDEAGNCVDAASCAAHSGTVQVRVSAVHRRDDVTAVSMRAWFAGDAAPAAFDLASSDASGSSSSLRFVADAERLISFEVDSLEATGACNVRTTQCLTTSFAGGQLAPGQYWLVLHDAATEVAHPQQSAVLSRLRLDVRLLAA